MTPESLYQLLPAIYRIRDIERGRPLEALMKVIGEQAAHIHADIEDLYDNWFIETCNDWAVPYLGELVGMRKSAPIGEPGDAAAASSTGLLKTLYPRREVSRLVDARRRKGTIKVFEDLARFVTGWKARIKENRCDQALSIIVGKTVANDGSVSARVGAAASSLRVGAKPLFRRSLKVSSDLKDVFRVGSSTTSLNLLLWRRFSQSLSRTEPAPIVDRNHTWKDQNGNAWDIYTFSPFGFDTPVMVHEKFVSLLDTERQQSSCPPKSCCGECEPTQARDLMPSDLIDPFKETRFVSGDLLRKDLVNANPKVPSLFYGDFRTLAVSGIEIGKVAVADLSSASRFLADGVSTGNEIVIDPKLGRLAFRPGTKEPVSYHFATSAMMGGGEYSRTTARHAQYPVHRFAPDSRVFPRDSQLDSFFAANLNVTRNEASISESVGFEFTGSTLYRSRTKVIRIRSYQILELRASNKSFPILRFVDQHDKLQTLTIEMEVGSQLSIDGLAIWAESIEIKYIPPEVAAPASFTLHFEASCGCDSGQQYEKSNTPPMVSLRHSTIVPRSKRFGDNPRNGLLKLCMPGGKFIAKHSVLAEIEVDNGCGFHDCPRSPLEILLEDSIVARSIDGKSEHAYAALKCARSTIMGTTRLHRIDAADDMIFCGTVCVVRRQFGSIRFSYVRPNPFLPRRYKCVPNTNLSVVPAFVGRLFGHYGFAQLSVDCDDEIRRGAESGSEMGAFHNLFEAQRRDRLETQLKDFTPVNMSSDFTFADELPPP